MACAWQTSYRRLFAGNVSIEAVCLQNETGEMRQGHMHHRVRVDFTLAFTRAKAIISCNTVLKIRADVHSDHRPPPRHTIVHFLQAAPVCSD